MKNSSLLSLEAYDSSSSDTDKAEEWPETKISPLIKSKSLLDASPSSVISCEKLVVASTAAESEGKEVDSQNPPTKVKFKLKKKVKNELGKKIKKSEKKNEKPSKKIEKPSKKIKKPIKKVKKSNKNVKENSTFEEAIVKKQLPDSDSFLSDDEKKSECGLVFNAEVSSEENQSSRKQIDCLSSWLIESKSEEKCYKDAVGVVDLSDSETNKTDDSSDENIHVFKVTHPKSKQSVSQAVKIKKKRKEKRKHSSPEEDIQYSKKSQTSPEKVKQQLKKKHSSIIETERHSKKKEQVKKVTNKTYTMPLESPKSILRCSSKNEEKMRLVPSECSSSKSSSSEEGQCTSDDGNDDGTLQAAKAACFSQFPHIFNKSVSPIISSKSKTLRKKHSMETKEDISTPISSSKRSFLKKESPFTSTPSSNWSLFSSKTDMSPFLLKRSNLKDFATPTSSNQRHSSVKENLSSPSSSNSQLMLSLPPPPPPPEEFSDPFLYFKRYPPPSAAPLKRSHSMMEEDSDNDKSTDTNKSFDFSSFVLGGRKSFPDRRSLGLPDKFKSRYDNNSRRLSLPGNNFNNANQISYSPGDSFYRPKRMRTELPYYNVSNLMTFKSEEGFIDCHCHIDFLFNKLGYKSTFSDYQKENKDTFPECFKGCLAIFCNPATFKKKHVWLAILEEENVWASFGCHPHNSWDYNDDVEKSLYSALEHPKVRALGEIGLDYSNRNNCPRDVQQNAFRRQLKIALEKKLPLVIHCREAHTDGMEIMKEMVPKNYSIHLHCFTDTWDKAEKWLQEFPRLYIGLTNVVTFPSASDVHEVARKIPLSRLLLETDAPYFTPKPLLKEHPNTRVSHPGMAIHVAAQIAGLKGGLPLELILSMTRQNCRNMYNI